MCWQVPLRLEHHTDDNGHVTSRLREWKRRDWGEGGNDFHWWCTESPEAFVGHEPVYMSSRDEIVELVGAHIYDLMVEQLERPEWIPLPHPAVAPLSATRPRPASSVVGFVVVVEADAVLLGEGGVLVVVVGLDVAASDHRNPGRTPRAGLLQLARLFEAAMTTLLHDRAPRD